MRDRALYPRLALTNIKSNGKLFFPYLLTCVFTVAMFYIMVFIKTNKGIEEMPGSDSLMSFLGFGNVIIGIYACVFLFYTNSFLMKRRKKELGLYNILGMGKRHIARILFYETAITGIGTLARGLAVGILMSKLVLLLLLKLLHFHIPFGFTVSAPAISASLCLFAVIFFVILLSNLLQIRLSKPIELLRGGEVGQREPKTKLLLTVIGVLALLSAYVIALTTKSPLQAIFLFFIAVILVILGTYLLFTTGSVTALKLMRRNKRFYYRTKHFISVSGMIYRMKQNAVGLANICILSTMVLVTVSTTVALYAGFEDIMDERFPNDLSITLPEAGEGELEAVAQKVRTAIAEHQLDLTSWQEYTALSFAAKYENGTFTADTENFSGVQGACMVSVITAPEYDRLTGEKTSLAPGEVLVYSNDKTPQDAIRLLGIQYTIRAHLDSFPIEAAYDAFLIPSYSVVVADEDARREIYDKQAEAYAGNRSERTGHIKADLKGETEQIIACYEKCTEAASRQETQTIVDENGNEQTVTYNSVYIECRQAASEEVYAMYGSFLFLGIFLGSLFLMATILIIYYKQVTEGYSDKERFSIMQKVGMSRQEVRQSIRSQVLTVFFLPLAAACVHIAFAFSIIVRLLAIFNLTNVPLFFWCTMGTIAVFAAVYGIIYAVTAKVYYKIVT
jgi:putative ABC transport system permease protein